MKLTLLVLSLIFLGQMNSAFAEDYPFYFGGAGGWPGIGGGIGAGYANPTFQTPNQESLPVFDTGIAGPESQYEFVKINTSCPLLTNSSKNESDIFSELKNFISTASKNPNCSLRVPDQNIAAILNNSTPNVSMLESMLTGESNSVRGGNSGVKCYSKNVELIGQRNLAYYYSKKMMADDGTSPFSYCLDLNATHENREECISKKYTALVDENTVVCKEMVAPQAVQKQINRGLIGLEQLLNQALSNKDECGFKSQDLFKVTMNTFLKAKALSVVGPWGAVAAFGAEMVGNLLDKLFPSDSQKAADLMDEILGEETFEQNACLYFNIQQKMYCEERPVAIATPNPGCNNIEVSSDLLKLIQKYNDIKKVTEILSEIAKPSLPAGLGANSKVGSRIKIPDTASGLADENSAIDVSPEMETAMIEHLDELSKFAISTEADLKNRIAILPKIQQTRELKKINKFLELMKDYQSYDPGADEDGAKGKKIMGQIASMLTDKSPDGKLDLAAFVVKSTPGTKLETIKQRSIARTIEQLMATKDIYVENESSRTQARYNKYKIGMGKIAKAKFEARLEKQYKEFETQVKFVASKDKGVINDPVAEGQLRNLIRHCSLLQEVYDPSLKGEMPKVCAKLTCQENKLNWFKPVDTQANFSGFKQNYCDKTLSFKKVEADYVKELQNKSGAKICGVNAESFF